jgi:hypothetical protein
MHPLYPPASLWALLCVAERRATRPNGEWRYSTCRHMLEPERPEAVLPDRALCLPTLSHFLIVNKLFSLSLSPLLPCNILFSSEPLPTKATAT